MPLTLKETCLWSAGSNRDKPGFLNDHAVIDARTELLAPDDRNLLRAVLIYNQPTKVIARMNRIGPAAVRYRVRKLIARISSPQFVGAARSLGLFNAEQAAVARCHILQGKSLQATASATSLPYHTVRSLLTEVAGIIEGVRNLKENYPSLKPYLHPPRKEKCTA